MIRYEWTDIEADIRILADKIKGELSRSDRKISAIIGIHRGGLVPAVMLSHLLNLPLKTLEWQTRDQGQAADVDGLIRILLDCPSDESLLVIDEIADSGKTLNAIHEQVGFINARFACFPIKVYYGVIVKRTACRLDMPVLSVHVLDSEEWVHFPWEAD
jgi:hypoxanthine phosphoribosyltransferase